MSRWREAATRVLVAQNAIVRATGDLDGMLAAMIAGVLDAIIGADGAVIEMRDGDLLVHKAVGGTAADHLDLRLPISGSLSGLCLQSGEPLICNDTEADDRVDRPACRRMGVRSMLAVALPGRNANIGVLKILSATPHAFDDDDLLHAQLLVTPIAFSLANAAQIEASKRFEATFDQAAVGMAHVSPDGNFLRVNDRFCQIVGRERGALCDGGFQEITHPEDLHADLDQLTALAAGQIAHYQMEKRYILRDGNWVWANLTVSMVAREDGAPDFFVAVIEDISKRKMAENLATRDALTGLPNRRAMLEHLSSMLVELPHAAEGFAVAYLDLDRFKQLNDRLGHAAGDACLATVSRLVEGAIRQSDIFFRLAGDEFLLLLKAAQDSDALRMLTRVRALIEAESLQRDWRIGVSFGLVTLPAGLHLEVEEVLERADRRMYAAKRLAA